MARIRLIREREGLSPTQLAVFEAVAASRGEVRGPFAVLLHQPEIAGGAQEIGAHLRYRSSIAGDVREAVILATAKMLGCEFEWYAHHPIALREGVPASTLAGIEAGMLDALPGDIGLAVACARSLVRDHALPAELFARAAQRWTEPQLVELVALVGYYAFLALTLNAFEVRP